MPLCGLFFRAPSYFSNHYYAFSLVIRNKLRQNINKIRSIKRVTANSDASGLAKSNLCGLRNSFVSQSSGTRDYSNSSLLMNVAWHNSNFTLVWFYYARAVWSDQAGFGLLIHYIF